MPLAKGIAQELSQKLGSVEIVHFSDGESHIRILETIRSKHIFVIQSGSAPANDHLFEALQIIHTCTQGGAKNVTAVFPFLPYRRQERAIHEKECVSAKLVAALIEKSGAGALITCNLHTPHIQTFYTIPVIDISPWNLFAEALTKRISSTDSFCIVAPDAGSVHDSTLLSKKLDIPLVRAEKSRPTPDTVSVKCVNGDVKNKNVLMVDDEINTAGTVIAIAAELKKLGAQKIFIAATHAVLSGNAQGKIENSSISEVLTTNTIHQKNVGGKITQIDTAPLFAQAINDIISSKNHE